MAIIDGTGRAGTIPMGVGKDMQTEMTGAVKGIPGESKKEGGFTLSADRVSISERARQASEAGRTDGGAARSEETQQDALTWTTVEIKNPRKD